MEVIFPGVGDGRLVSSWQRSLKLRLGPFTDGKTEVVSTQPAFLPSILPLGQSIFLHYPSG